MGHSRTIGRAAKMAWKKKWSRIVIADRDTRSCGTDPILSTQRIPRGRDQVGAILMKLVVFLKENVSRLNNFQKSSFPIWKSIIDRFYNSKRGLWGRSSRKWLFSLSKTHSGRMFFISFLTSGPKTYHWSVLRPEVRNENVGSPLGELSAAVRIKHLAKKSRIVL